MRGLEFRGKFNWMKAAAFCHPCPSDGHLSLEHRGSDPTWNWVRPPEAHRWSCLWSPGVRVGPTFSSWNNSFHTIDY